MWALRILAGILALVFAGAVTLFFQQHSLVYHPRPYDASHATMLSSDGVELRYATLAGQQTAFYLPRGRAGNAPEDLWIAFGGNAALALEWSGLIARDPNSSNAYLLIEYPGYGKSEGRASLATNRAAADGALAALARHLSMEETALESRLNVIGHSSARPRRLILPHAIL